MADLRNFPDEQLAAIAWRDFARPHLVGGADAQDPLRRRGVLPQLVSRWRVGR
jgi:hypothetical protein